MSEASAFLRRAWGPMAVAIVVAAADGAVAAGPIDPHTARAPVTRINPNPVTQPAGSPGGEWAVASSAPTQISVRVARHILFVAWKAPKWGDWYTVELRTSAPHVTLAIPANMQSEIDRRIFNDTSLDVPIPPAVESAMLGQAYLVRVCAYNKLGGACAPWVSTADTLKNERLFHRKEPPMSALEPPH